ncbi:MAG TPA: phage baseplate assembly protein V [Ktedonobacterales bacterium]|nr:phage baseplate assembly protein V [Ktedonobacterales bacterium]
MIARCVISRTHDATDAGIQLTEVTLLRDEAKVAVERFQQYGFTSHVPDESEGIVLFVGGDRAHGILISADNRATRLPGLAEGEVALYSAWGSYIALCGDDLIDILATTLRIRGEDNTVTIQAKDVVIEAENIKLVGDVRIEGNVEIVGNLVVHGRIDAQGVWAPQGHVGP